MNGALSSFMNDLQVDFNKQLKVVIKSYAHYTVWRISQQISEAAFFNSFHFPRICSQFQQVCPQEPFEGCPWRKLERCKKSPVFLEGKCKSSVCFLQRRGRVIFSYVNPLSASLSVFPCKSRVCFSGVGEEKSFSRCMERMQGKVLQFPRTKSKSPL